MTVVMKCGHAANATAPNGSPACAICIGIHPGATEAAPQQPETEGRMMRCTYAMAGSQTHRGGGQYAGQDFPSVRPSSTDGAFFASRPDKAEDEFYCGCWGWD